MTTISGNNITYTIDDIFNANGLILDRTNITTNSIDFFPDGTYIASKFNGKLNISIEINLYNANTIYQITTKPGIGGTMRPGIPGGAQEDIIQPNSLKKYIIIVRSSTTYDIFNLSHNGQIINSEKIITNNIENYPGNTEVIIYNNATNIVLGQGGTSSNSDGSMTIYGNLFNFSSVSQLDAQDNLNYTVGQIFGGLILRNPGSSNRIDTFPTAANIIAAIPKVKIGTSFFTRIQNTGSKRTIEVNAGTGITFSGTDRTISKERTKIFMISITNITPGSESITIYIIGSLIDADDATASLIKTITSNTYSIISSDNTINVDTVTIKSTCTLTLPLISIVGQKRYFITDSTGKAGQYNIRIVSSGSDTIIGTTSVTINSNYSSISMYNDELNNWILY